MAHRKFPAPKKLGKKVKRRTVRISNADNGFVIDVTDEFNNSFSDRRFISRDKDGVRKILKSVL